MKKYLFLIILFSASYTLFSQAHEVDKKKLESLLQLRKEMINNYQLKSFYTIQLFSGKQSGAEQVKNEYDASFRSHKATIEFETPNYKVWVGRFRTKLEADKVYHKLSKDYPSALVFRPGR